MKATTTNLSMDRRTRLASWWHSRGERTTRDALWGAAFCVFILLIHSLLKPVEAPLQPIVQQPAVMIVATAQPQPPLPTLTPWPTPVPPEPVVIVEQVPPEVQYVEVYVPVQSPPTLPPIEYQSTDAERWAGDSAPNSEYIDQSVVIEPAPVQPDVNAKDHIAGPPPEGTQSSGGSGKSAAPDVSFDSNAEWCAAAAAANAGARCVEGQP